MINIESIHTAMPITTANIDHSIIYFFGSATSGLYLLFFNCIFYLPKSISVCQDTSLQSLLGMGNEDSRKVLINILPSLLIHSMDTEAHMRIRADHSNASQPLSRRKAVLLMCLSSLVDEDLSLSDTSLGHLEDSRG